MNYMYQSLQSTSSYRAMLGYALLFLLCGAFLAFLLDMAEIYRVFAYAQLLPAAWLGHECWKNGTLSSNGGHRLFWMVPLMLIVVHMLAVGEFRVIKEMRHILLAMSLAFSIWLLLTQSAVSSRIIRNSVLACIVVYMAVQFTCVYGMNLPYGTTKNPHYLAQGCMLFALVCGYLFVFASVRMKIFLALLVLLLLGMLLMTSSRPAWIAFFLGNVIVFWQLSKERKLLFGVALITAVIALAAVNLENFTQRMLELLRNFTTEERVFIWHDAWQMQMSSSGIEWLFGHGLDGFDQSFPAYSTYHHTGIDFNSPHNFFLELIYLNGIVGLVFILAFFAQLYLRLWQFCRSDRQALLAMLMTALLTSNLFLVSITVPFYSGYNMIIIALVTGVMLYLHSSRTDQYSSL